MSAFGYRDGILHAEEVSLAVIAEQVGTPCYVYAAGAMRARIRAFQAAFAGMRALFCYAVKDHVVIAGLLPGGPGEQAGLKSGDVILAVDGQEVGDRRSLYRLLWTHRSGEAVTLKIFRGRELRNVTVASGDVEEFFG